MIRYFILLGFVFALNTNPSFGQTDEIETDRPGETESPFIVPENFIQIENGFSIDKQNGESKTYKIPSTLWKYGLNERFEFRLITELVSEKENNKTETGLKPLTLGFKVNICAEKGLIPMTSFIGHLTSTNLGSAAFHTPYFAPSFRFTMRRTLTEKISLGYNLGAEWDGETAEPTFIYTLSTELSFTKKLGGFVEVYGFAPQDSKADHNIDGGLTYLLNNNLMIDISGGYGLTENARDNFLSVGLSYRFTTRHNKHHI
ncbi:MAG: transporter [Ferruginibacter sp.]